MEKRKNKLIVFLLVLSLIIFLAGFYINSKVVLDKKEISAKLTVGDKLGFDINKSMLSFGMIKSGSASNRDLMIENNYSFPIEMEFSAEGDIKRFLLFEKIIYLNVGESKLISISTIDPVNEEFGNYSGKLIVVTRKTENFKF